MYLAKCNAYYFGTKRVGLRTSFFIKFILGFCGLIGLISLIFGPMVLFSSLNPIAQDNLVKGANIEIGLVVNGTNYYPLFMNSHINDIHSVNDIEWTDY